MTTVNALQDRHDFDNGSRSIFRRTAKTLVKAMPAASPPERMRWPGSVQTTAWS